MDAEEPERQRPFHPVGRGDQLRHAPLLGGEVTSLRQAQYKRQAQDTAGVSITCESCVFGGFALNLSAQQATLSRVQKGLLATDKCGFFS